MWPVGWLRSAERCSLTRRRSPHCTTRRRHRHRSLNRRCVPFRQLYRNVRVRRTRRLARATTVGSRGDCRSRAILSPYNGGPDWTAKRHCRHCRGAVGAPQLSLYEQYELFGRGRRPRRNRRRRRGLAPPSYRRSGSRSCQPGSCGSGTRIDQRHGRPHRGSRRSAYRVVRSQKLVEGNRGAVLLLARWLLHRNSLDDSEMIPHDDREFADLLVRAAAGGDGGAVEKPRLSASPKVLGTYSGGLGWSMYYHWSRGRRSS